MSGRGGNVGPRRSARNVSMLPFIIALKSRTTLSPAKGTMAPNERVARSSANLVRRPNYHRESEMAGLDAAAGNDRPTVLSAAPHGRRPGQPRCTSEARCIASTARTHRKRLARTFRRVACVSLTKTSSTCIRGSYRHQGDRNAMTEHRADLGTTIS
jgi:hypothetical protein